MHHARGYSNRTSSHAAWSVLVQCCEDMNEPQKALQLRIVTAHKRHDAEEWDRLARESKYDLFGAKMSYARLKYYLQGSWLQPTSVVLLPKGL